MKVKHLIKHLSKYPANLEVSIYRHPVKAGMRIIAPSNDPTKEANHWLYSHKRLFIPVKEMIRGGALPGHYKVPRLKMALAKAQRLRRQKRLKEEAKAIREAKANDKG